MRSSLDVTVHYLPPRIAQVATYVSILVTRTAQGERMHAGEVSAISEDARQLRDLADMLDKIAKVNSPADAELTALRVADLAALLATEIYTTHDVLYVTRAMLSSKDRAQSESYERELRCANAC